MFKYYLHKKKIYCNGKINETETIQVDSENSTEELIKDIPNVLGIVNIINVLSAAFSEIKGYSLILKSALDLNLLLNKPMNR